VGLTLWKCVPLKIVGHTLIFSNKRVGVRENVEKRVSSAFLFFQIIHLRVCLVWKRSCEERNKWERESEKREICEK